MQVASTLWLDIKSQKISEQRFRLKWTSVAQEPLQIRSRQAEASMDQTREARTAQRKKIAGGYGESHPVAPCYKYKRVEIRTHTTLTSSQVHLA